MVYSLDWLTTDEIQELQRAAWLPGTHRPRREVTARKALQWAPVGAGVPRDQIDVVGIGETDPPVATGNDVSEPQNRRVAINYTTSPPGG